MSARLENPGSQSTPKSVGYLPCLAIMMAELNASLAKRLGIDKESEVVIVKALTGSPAGKARLTARDMITKFTGTTVSRGNRSSQL